jgi:hypothetical protein
MQGIFFSVLENGFQQKKLVISRENSCLLQNKLLMTACGHGGRT